MQNITAKIERWDGKGFSSLVIRGTDARFVVDKICANVANQSFDYQRNDVNDGVQIRVYGPKRKTVDALVVACGNLTVEITDGAR